MIVKFFKRGDDPNTRAGECVENYLMDEKRVADGTAVVLRGDPKATTQVINSLPFASTYTSGVLSFDVTDCPTPEQQEQIMNDFEQALLPDFDKSRYQCYWVKHTDKGNVELNFVIAKVDLETGKYLNPYYHSADLERVDLFKQITNRQYGFKEPDDHRRAIAPVGENPHIKPSKNRQDWAGELTNIVEQHIAGGYIQNRDDVVSVLNSISDDDYSFEVTRQSKPKKSEVHDKGKGYITVTITDKQTKQTNAVRLKGAYYEPRFTATQEVIHAVNERHRSDTASLVRDDTDRHEHEQDLSELLRQYHICCEYRRDWLNRRYSPNGETQRANDTGRAISSNSNQRDTQPTPSSGISENNGGRKLKEHTNAIQSISRDDERKLHREVKVADLRNVDDILPAVIEHTVTDISTTDRNIGIVSNTFVASVVCDSLGGGELSLSYNQKDLTPQIHYHPNKELLNERISSTREDASNDGQRANQADTSPNTRIQPLNKWLERFKGLGQLEPKIEFIKSRMGSKSIGDFRGSIATLDDRAKETGVRVTVLRTNTTMAKELKERYLTNQRTNRSQQLIDQANSATDFSKRRIASSCEQSKRADRAINNSKSIIDRSQQLIDRYAKQRLARERAEAQRLAQEQERLARAELARQRQEQELLAQAHAERQRQAQAKAEAERRAREQERQQATPPPKRDDDFDFGM